MFQWAVRLIKLLQSAGVSLEQFFDENVPSAYVSELKSTLNCNSVSAGGRLRFFSNWNVQEKQRCPFGVQCSLELRVSSCMRVSSDANKVPKYA